MLQSHAQAPSKKFAQAILEYAGNTADYTSTSNSYATHSVKDIISLYLEITGLFRREREVWQVAISKLPRD